MSSGVLGAGGAWGLWVGRRHWRRVSPTQGGVYGEPQTPDPRARQPGCRPRLPTVGLRLGAPPSPAPQFPCLYHGVMRAPASQGCWADAIECVDSKCSQ